MLKTAISSEMSSDFNSVNVEDQTTDKNAYQIFKQSMINRL